VSPPGAATQAVPEVYYRLRQSASSRWPGGHRSRGGDAGFEFRAHRALSQGGDARRIDVHASLRDPMGWQDSASGQSHDQVPRRSDWLVRLHAERLSVPVMVVADLSASMGFIGRHARMQVLADLVRSLAWSAGRAGDSFGFVGCAEQVAPAWFLPASRARGAGLALADRLAAHRPAASDGSGAGRHAGALAEALRYLPRQRSLVFLVSDFHLPPPLIEATLTGLSAHELVPVVLEDEAEALAPPRTRFGHALMNLQDPETGRERLVWWRPELAERQARETRERRAALDALFSRLQLRPVRMNHGYEADRLTAHFLG
jgi:uncharacterized protein (DUF58 family)